MKEEVVAVLARVPFNDLRRQYEHQASALESAALDVMRSGWYALGPHVEAFESEFAAYCGTAGCVGVANGTDALELAMRVVGCGPGCEVIMVANAGMYAAAACIAVGAIPVFIDIDPSSLTLDLDKVRELVTPMTRAIVITHLYGIVVDVDAVRVAVEREDVAIIEDVAQAHGGLLGGRRTGSLGDVASFSFYPTKNLGALGDGGAVTSNDPAVIDAIRELRQYGWTERFHANRAGGRNSRLDEIQAAMLRVKLPNVDAGNARRCAIAAQYVEAADGRLRFAHESASAHVGHLCVARHEQRERLMAGLADCGIGTAVHYPIPDHVQPALSSIPFRHMGLAETEKSAREVFSVPCFPELTDDEVGLVCEALSQVL